MRGPALYAARRGLARPAPAWARLEEAPAWTPPRVEAAPAPVANFGHPLADPRMSQDLRRAAQRIEAAFAGIEPTLTRLAPNHFDADFPDQAQRALAEIGLALPPKCFAAHVMAPLDMRFLYARCVIAAFARLLSERHEAPADSENARSLIHQWGFHAVDVAACADGRLAGVLDHILRLPRAIVAFRSSHAGALFNITESLRRFERIELTRFRDAQPNPAAEPTRYLKLGVYHFSRHDPAHHGCAAHGGDTERAAGALLERLQDFAQSVRNVHRAEIATLLVGVDTDHDALRVHVPDRNGQMQTARYVDSLALYEETAGLGRDAAKDHIRQAVAASAGGEPAATEGMRWLCAYLLKNNLAQVDAVRQAEAGRPRDAGHTEKLIVVGDPVDELQLRNLAFQAQMETVEEGAADLDTGVKILRRTHEAKGLAAPVLVHFRYDPRLPRAAERAGYKARRMMGAILARYAPLASRKKLFVQAALRAADGSELTILDPTPEALTRLETLR